MKGLLVKDLRITVQQKFLLFLMAGCGLLCVFTMKEPTFIIGYITLLCGMMGTTTCAYDDLNNGMAFIMTLPHSRTAYVVEKYLFSILFGIIGWSLSTAFAAACKMMLVKEPIDAGFINTALLFVGPIVMIPAIMIPILLKFGQARSRIVMFAIFGLILAAGSVLAAAPSFSVAVDSEELAVQIITFGIPSFLSAGLILGIGIAVSITVFLVSFLLSLAIIKKKEY